MKMLVLKTWLVLSVWLICIQTNAQCSEWSWPEDRKKAEEQVTLLQDAMRDKKYRQAVRPFNWIVANAPRINQSLYVHGSNMFDALASKEKDAGRKKIYVDSLLFVYDLRMAYCGDKENVMWRKALSAFKFLINGNEASKVLSIMDSVFSIYPNTVNDGLLLPYMQTIVINHQKFKTPNEEGILSRYDQLASITDTKIKSSGSDAKQKAKLIKTRKDIDEWLFKVIKPDCDFVRTNLAPRFKQNPSDITLAKRIFSYMLQGNCTEDPLWIETGEIVFASEKDFGLGKNIGLRYLAMENIKQAETYFNESLALAPNRKDSSDVFYYKGIIESKKSNKINAREYYMKAIAFDKIRRDAYERIGDLYFGSFDECAQKTRQADDRAIYIAAYAWYAKAGNTKKMAMAKQLFPSREEIFVVNYQKGDHIKVDCWINEEVIIQTRD